MKAKRKARKLIPGHEPRLASGVRGYTVWSRGALYVPLIYAERPGSGVDMLARLRALGIQLHMDDFGTGYSSLSYLHRFQIDTLKIDRSFISAMGDRGENSEIVRTIVTLARNLGIEVIAEGVETSQQLDQLRALGCGQVQGFFFSPPVPHQAAAALVERSAVA